MYSLDYFLWDSWPAAKILCWSKGAFWPFEDKIGIGQTNTACQSQVRGKLHDFEEISARRIVRPVTCYIYMVDFYISNTVMCMLYWNIQIMYPWKGLFLINGQNLMPTQK